jgi:hypothetical protein
MRRGGIHGQRRGQDSFFFYVTKRSELASKVRLAFAVPSQVALARLLKFTKRRRVSRTISYPQ